MQQPRPRGYSVRSNPAATADRESTQDHPATSSAIIIPRSEAAFLPVASRYETAEPPEMALRLELLRTELVDGLQSVIRGVVKAARTGIDGEPARPSTQQQQLDDNAATSRSCVGLFTAFVLEALAERSSMSISVVAEAAAASRQRKRRQFILPHDVGNAVSPHFIACDDKASGSAACATSAATQYILREVRVGESTVRLRVARDMNGGTDCEVGGSQNDEQDVTAAAWRLVSSVDGQPVLDTLLPCGTEFADGRGVSASLMKRLMTVLHDSRTRVKTAEGAPLSKKGEDAAAELAHRVTVASFEAVQRLASERLSPTPWLIGPPQVVVSGVVGNADGGGRESGVIQATAQDSVVTVRCGAFRHELLQTFYDKLRQLYVGPHPEFHLRLFCLLQRYFNLSGAPDDCAQDSGWHGGVPETCLAAMHSKLGVQAECFASPFNTSSASYCSAFVDVDGAFGSLGSFFDFHPAEGSFEANPPFDHTVSLRMAQHMNALLRRRHHGAVSTPAVVSPTALGNKARLLRFVVVLPFASKGRELPSMSAALSELRNGGFVAREVVLPAAQAVYIDGLRQCNAGAVFSSRLDTIVVVLQSPIVEGAATADSCVEAGLDAVVSSWSVFSASAKEAVAGRVAARAAAGGQKRGRE